MTSAHQSSAWQALSKARIALGRAAQEPCGICGNDIDYTLRGNSRWGATTDHPDQLQLGGELLPPLHELRIAHRRCNSQLGTRVANAIRPKPPRTKAGTFAPKPKAERAAELAKNTGSYGSEGGSFFRSGHHDPAAQEGTTPRVPLERPRRAKKWPVWFPDTLRTPPDNASWPRLETPFHPNACGTYGELVWKIAASYGIKPRWWQAYCTARLLEHDQYGQLCWLEAAISTARQVGKGYGFIRPLAEWRMNSADLFGEPQTILHLSAQVNTVMEIATPSIARHREDGDRVRLTNGEQSITIADGSRWLMRSTTGAYGFSVSMAICDEVWGIQPRAIDSMVSPTMVERIQPQLVMTSTANARCTPTYPVFAAASGVEEDRLLLEFSAPPEAKDDPGNRRYWRMAAPHWSPQRERLMVRQLEKASRADFISNWLNVWPDLAKAEDKALPGWAGLGVAPDNPHEGGIVALDEFRDASKVGLVRLIGNAVYYDEYWTLAEAVAEADTADTVIVGLSLREAAPKAGLTTKPITFGVHELAMYTPLLQHRVRTKAIVTDHDERMADQAAGAVVNETESGKTLSAKRSGGEIVALKLAAWAMGLERAQESVAPAIYV